MPFLASAVRASDPFPATSVGAPEISVSGNFCATKLSAGKLILDAVRSVARTNLHTIHRACMYEHACLESRRPRLYGGIDTYVETLICYPKENRTRLVYWQIGQLLK